MLTTPVLLAVFIIIPLVLAPGTSTTSLRSCVLDIINAVPSLHIGTSSIVSSNITSNPVLVGYLMIDGNMWGLSEHRGSFNGSLVVRIDEKGFTRFKAELDLAGTRMKTWNVIAYPELSYGLKPWTPELRPLVSKHLPLPMPLATLPRTLVLVDYAVVNSSTAYNVAFDVWVLRGPGARTPRDGDVEVMIWLHRHGEVFLPNPAGRKVGIVKAEVLVDGEFLELPFEVWVQERMGDGWMYVAFVLVDSRPYREVGLDVSFFLEKTAELLKLDKSTYSVFSIEFGFELFYSPLVKFDATIYRYDIVISKDVGVGVLRALTPRSKRLIAWIVPWGYPVDLDGFNMNFTPGIIVAYDVDCGLCTNDLQVWLKESTRYIESFRSRGEIVFVNIFPEKYNPTWRWRGELKVFRFNETLINRLKRVLGDGEGVYIGFSELTACVNDEDCRVGVVEAYKLLRSLFPASRLFYYGSGGENVESLLALYKDARLDLIGIDVWDYEYIGGGIYVARYVAEKIAHLGKLVPRHAFMVGEVGFRLNDREGYVEAWNKHRAVVYEKGAHITYYKHVIEHMFNIAKPSYLGIWSWNDEAYSIGKDPETQNALVEVARSRGLAPEIVCREATTEAVVRPGVEFWTPLLVALSAGILVLVVLLLRKKVGTSETMFKTVEKSFNMKYVPKWYRSTRLL